MFHAGLAACKDPAVRLLKAQNLALELLPLGLRPKQVANITELSPKRVNQLRECVIPAADRAARPPMSAATILRQAELRAASSFFFSVYQRVLAVSDGQQLDWDLFHESYGIYAHQSSMVAKGRDEVLPILPIEDAWTLMMALERGGLEAVLCEQHGTRYLTILDHHRTWRCPYCTRADRKRSSNGRPMPHVIARTEPDFGVRAGNIDHGESRRVGA